MTRSNCPRSLRNDEPTEIVLLCLGHVVEHTRPDGLDTGAGRTTRHDEKGSRR